MGNDSNTFILRAPDMAAAGWTCDPWLDVLCMPARMHPSAELAPFTATVAASAMQVTSHEFPKIAQ